LYNIQWRKPYQGWYSWKKKCESNLTHWLALLITMFTKDWQHIPLNAVLTQTKTYWYTLWVHTTCISNCLTVLVNQTAHV